MYSCALGKNWAVYNREIGRFCGGKLFPFPYIFNPFSRKILPSCGRVMALPKIVIIGRPNVGKSSLFNRILHRKAAIVADKEGVTRDRLCQKGIFRDKPFFLIDTGGIESSSIPFAKELKIQAEIALKEADSILFVVDGSSGVTLFDERVVEKIRKTKKPIYLVVNKADTPEKEEEMTPVFYALGIEKIFFVSCLHNRNIELLLEEVTQDFLDEVEEEDLIKVALIGRPNVGKSTLLNAFLQQERVIVSEKQGTTRDAVDEIFEKEGKKYLFIDTAGIRKRNKEKEVEEFFSSFQTEKAVERADICLLLLDSSQGITIEEKRIFQKVEEKGKGCILLLNKWDLVKGFQMEHALQGIRRVAPFSSFLPSLFLSAKTGRNVEAVFPLIEKVYTNLTKEVSTSSLNQFLEKQLQRVSPPMIQGKRFKIFYASQTGKKPPQFLVFANKTSLLAGSYRRYLIHQLRKEYDFTGCPLRFHVKGKTKVQN